MAFNRKAKLRDNIEAIRTVFTLDREQRTPTAEERAILEKYCGFGGLKCILNPAKDLTDAVHWAKSDLDLFAPTVELHKLIRENSKDDTEYKRYVDSLKASILTAFYTPKEITDVLAEVLDSHGIQPKRLLEPSAGRGAFVDSLVRHNPDADIMAFEKDLLTGKLLKHLYPDKKVRIEGFEKIEKPFLNRFDVAMSNIPFGDIAVFDPVFAFGNPLRKQSAKHIHNYFFLKGLDAVRDGGIVAFITSQGVLNSETSSSTRFMMMKQADLVSAIRLPNNLFVNEANTEVGSDLIILQKNEHKEQLSEADKIFTQTTTQNNIGINRYLAEHPERIVHTSRKVDTDPYGKPALVYHHEGGVTGIAADLRNMLSEDLRNRLDMERYVSATVQTVRAEPIKEEKPKAEIPKAVQQTTVEQPKQVEKPAEEKKVIDTGTGAIASETPVMSLFDLWNFTEEERKAAQSGQKLKNAKGGKKPRTNLYNVACSMCHLQAYPKKSRKKRR